MQDTPTAGHLSDVFNSERIRPGLFSRMLPSLLFYSRIAGILVKTAREIDAGKGCYELYSLRSADIARAAKSVGARLIVENAEVFKTAGPCVVAGNHMSSLETMVLQSVMMPFCPMTFVAKAALMKYPVFSTPLKACDPIIVGRTSPREDLKLMMEQTHDRITRGISVVVFPQTTRTVVFSPEHFNSIGAKLARREKVPLVPLALRTDFWGCGWPVKDLGRIRPELDIRFRFGDPVDSSDERLAQKKTVDFITASLKEWGVGE
ncbi:MAG TPA: lysophospholipid acyltransferase family protein [Opitutales bacterium]|nr:lysophospholipid acyltransferase family protein [Opitutales bacterium]